MANKDISSQLNIAAHAGETRRSIVRKNLRLVVILLATLVLPIDSDTNMRFVF